MSDPSIVNVFDNMKTKDQTQGQMPYERTVENLNIEDKADVQFEKRLSSEWYPIIIDNTIDVVSENISPLQFTHDRFKRQIDLGFETEDKLTKFNNKFHMELFKQINKYISNVVGDNPKNYNRAMILDTQVTQNKLTISY